MDKGCPINKTLVNVSGKWTLLILRELNDNGKKRFNEMLNGMKPISARTLAKRLRQLGSLGLVSKQKFNEIPPRVDYSLTKKGRDLMKCFRYMEKWVMKHNVN